MPRAAETNLNLDIASQTLLKAITGLAAFAMAGMLAWAGETLISGTKDIVKIKSDIANVSEDIRLMSTSLEKIEYLIARQYTEEDATRDNNLILVRIDSLYEKIGDIDSELLIEKERLRRLEMKGVSSEK